MKLKQKDLQHIAESLDIPYMREWDKEEFRRILERRNE